MAAANPTVVDHAVEGRLTDFERAALLTDGATRLVETFKVLRWASLLDLLASAGPRELIRRTRKIEASDPAGVRWPRNKQSDDATVVYIEPGSQS